MVVIVIGLCILNRYPVGGSLKLSHAVRLDECQVYCHVFFTEQFLCCDIRLSCLLSRINVVITDDDEECVCVWVCIQD